MSDTDMQPTDRRWPAEFEAHDATWISWPWNPEDWPGKFETIPWVYAEIVRLIGKSERVEIICNDTVVKEQALTCLAAHRVPEKHYRIHILKTDRSWLRDSAPTAVFENGRLAWAHWLFNAWAKYDNYHLDRSVPALVSEVSGGALIEAFRPDNNARFVIEGGAIDGDGRGTLLTTEECLLSKIQERNPGLSRAGYEEVFKQYLGITKTIWLEGSCAGDDTHGHVDDAARFIAEQRVVVACEEDPADDNFKVSQENVRILQGSTDALGRKLEVIKLPMPAPIFYEEDRLPASYANFYIANSTVVVPTFNDPNDRMALEILARCFPQHQVVGIHSLDLVLGFGTLHCLSQQQPRVITA